MNGVLGACWELVFDLSAEINFDTFEENANFG